MIETVLWLLIGLTALGASGLLSIVYYRDWRRIVRLPRLPIGEPVRIPAWANLRRELLRALTLLLFVAAGAISLVRMGVEIEHGRLITLICLMAGQGVMAVNAWADWQDDRRLLRAVDEWDQRYVAVPKDGHQAPSRDR